jgi:N-glycosylase/DNA lyase
MPDLHTDINIRETINSGQVFLWENYGNEWFVIDGHDIIMARQTPFEVLTFSKKAKKFFREDDNYEKILKNITKDKIVKKATKHYPGLRVTRQDPFQCCISFIVSSNSNIPNIRMRLQKLCRKFGTKVRFEKREFFLFPRPKRLAKATLQDLQECKLGYRSKYVLDASRAIASGEIDFDELKKADYREGKESLLKLPGIGDKVADCVMLFSLEKLEAFPLDTWIVKILQKYYSDNFCMDKKTISKKRYENIHRDVLDHFGKYAGYSQQFLYKMERDLNEKKWL